MKIVVTGGSGLTGYHVVEDLLEHDYEVNIVDRVRPKNDHAPYRFVDLENLGQAFGALDGADAVVHLAAIPRPIYDTNEVVFRTNIMTTYNVLEAAITLGIPKVVYASSISVIGYPFYYRYFAPAYVPIDENHPKLPQDPYAMSKYLGEEIAKSFVRRGDINVISLRLAWVHTPESFKEQIMPMWGDPDAGASNLWWYVDGRDAAQAFRLALASNLQGHQAFFIGAPDSFMKIPSQQLIKDFYPDTEVRPELTGNTALVSSRKAEEALGYKAQHTWKTYF